MAAASGAGATGNTVFLEPQNRIVEDFMTKFVSEDAPTKPVHLVVGDFDGEGIAAGSFRAGKASWTFNTPML
jgi:hypothetical protein